MLKTIVGHSIDPDTSSAIDEVLDQCLTQLQGDIPQAGLLLAAIDFDHALILQRLQDTFPGLQLIGGTTDGEISSTLGSQEDSLVLMLFCSDTIAIRAGLGRAASQDPLAAAQQAIAQANHQSDRLSQLSNIKFCLTIPDGISASGVVIVNSLKQVLGAAVPIVGGMAGDQARFQQTYQFCGREVVSDAIPVLLFSGDILLSYGVTSGWQPISRKAVVTKAAGAIVYEIDHKPATEFYSFYLKGMTISGEYPVAVFEQDNSEFYLRASNQKDNTAGSILFMGDVPEGATVQITHAGIDDILSASQASVQQALSRYPGQHPTTALLISCGGRRWLLGSRFPEEYQLMEQALPSLTTIGFYSYGEIAPLADGVAYYHQETLVTVLIGVE